MLLFSATALKVIKLNAVLLTEFRKHTFLQGGLSALLLKMIIITSKRYKNGRKR